MEFPAVDFSVVQLGEFVFLLISVPGPGVDRLTTVPIVTIVFVAKVVHVVPSILRLHANQILFNTGHQLKKSVTVDSGREGGWGD